MEVKLEDLIEKIRKDGIEETKKASEEMIKNAKEEASKIINNARDKATKLMEEAKQETTQFKKNAEAALNRAGRDLILSLREQLIGLFDNILKCQLSEVLTPEFLKELIVKIVDNWSPDKGLSLEVLVSAQDKQRLEELLFSHFREAAKDTIVIKTSNNIDKGFRIGIKGEDVHYDFSDEGILESLKEFLNPAISRVLNG